MEEFNEILKRDAKASIKTYKKGTLIQVRGEITSNAYFVKKGILRSYIIDSKGKEHIFMFASEGWLIADIESQEFEQPAELYIDCLEDTDVVIINRNCLKEESMGVELIIKNMKLLYRRMGVLQRRVLMLMSSPALDRYNYFLETYPELPNRIPQHMIASYLGITPQALSTIRAKMAKSK